MILSSSNKKKGCHRFLQKPTKSCDAVREGSMSSQEMGKNKIRSQEHVYHTAQKRNCRDRGKKEKEGEKILEGVDIHDLGLLKKELVYQGSSVRYMLNERRGGEREGGWIENLLSSGLSEKRVSSRRRKEKNLQSEKEGQKKKEEEGSGSNRRSLYEPVMRKPT